MSKKKKKEKWEIVIKDRFLTNEKPDNPYVTAFLYFIVFFLSFLLIFVCFFQLCSISGHSMENSLYEGEHVLLLKNSSDFKHGDIVVITKDVTVNGKTQKTNIIKRVIGLEGDVLVFKTNDENNEVSLLRKSKGSSEDPQLVNESYIKEPMLKNSGKFSSEFAFDTEIPVPEGMVFVMGDNRNHSDDSRLVDGYCFSVSNVLGKSMMKIDKGSVLEFLLKLLYHENNTANEYE